MAQAARENRRKKEKTEVIGIAGSGPAVGATHFSIQTANYLSGVLGRRTAVLERNKSGAFSSLETVCSQKNVLRAKRDTFKVFEVFYLKSAGKTELLEWIDSGFDTVIIDFGRAAQADREELLLCDRRFLLGSFCAWQVEDFTRLAVDKKCRRGGWEYFYAFGGEEAAREMRRRLHVSVKKIPLSQDAFAVTGDTMAFFEGFLE